MGVQTRESCNEVHRGQSCHGDNIEDFHDRPAMSRGDDDGVWHWLSSRSRLSQALLTFIALAATYIIFILVCLAVIYSGQDYI